MTKPSEFQPEDIDLLEEVYKHGLEAIHTGEDNDGISREVADDIGYHDPEHMAQILSGLGKKAVIHTTETRPSVDINEASAKKKTRAKVVEMPGRNGEVNPADIRYSIPQLRQGVSEKVKEEQQAINHRGVVRAKASLRRAQRRQRQA